MTIICPRCAARFSVAGSSGITCPACGARLALRDDPSRRSSTPAATTRRPHAVAPIIDLPVPKRALTVTLEPLVSTARVSSSVPGIALGKRPAARSQERWRLRSEQLADLPEPVGETPRPGRKSASVPGAPAAKLTAPTLAPPVVERAPPRIPVTRPEIPAGLPVRDEEALARAAAGASLAVAAATKQELAPVVAERPETQPLTPTATDVTRGKEPAARPPEPARVAVAAQPLEPAPPVVSASQAPAVVPARVPGAIREAAPPGPTMAGTGQAKAVAAPERSAIEAPTKRPEASEVRGTDGIPAADPPPAAAADSTLRAGEPAGPGTSSADAAPPADSDEPTRSDENQAPPDVVPPPALQLGWVIAVLLGLSVLLIVWILYRASVGH